MEETTPENLYTEEEIEQIAELMDTIISIRRRLFSEGVDVDALIKELQERDYGVELKYGK